MTPTTTLTSAEKHVYDYVAARRGRASYLMAVPSWSTASSYILATGQEVLPMGGFSGSVPEPTLARARHLVATGQLKFFLLDRGTGFALGGGGGSGSSQAQQIENWVAKTCRRVPPREYGGVATTGGAGLQLPGPGGSGSSQTLYDCGTDR
jgi:4-amino-4-deoxy-L-arabinose transferase-like glycosyltransferase